MKEVLYYLCERRLLRQMRSGPIAAHIGITLDGNRRYGRRHSLTDPHAIYSLGARKLDEVLEGVANSPFPRSRFGFSPPRISSGRRQRAFKISGLTWIVERSFAWLGRNRRLSRDYEYQVQTSEAMIDLASIRLMSNRIASA